MNIVLESEKPTQHEDKAIFDYCSFSDEPIYVGESYLETLDGGILKDEKEILICYYQVLRKWAGEEII